MYSRAGEGRLEEMMVSISEGVEVSRVRRSFLIFFGVFWGRTSSISSNICSGLMFFSLLEFRY